VERVIISTLFSMLDLVSEVIIALFVIALLMWVDWGVTLAVFAVLVGVHFLINLCVSPPLDRYGKKHAALEARIYSHVLEALKLHKEIKLANIDRFFVNRYARACDKMVHTNLMRNLISDMPAYLLELVAFSIILAVAIYFALFTGGDTQPVTIIGVYAVAAYRLIPAIARIFNKIESIWYDTAILEDVARALQPLAEVDLAEGSAHSLDRSIVMQDIFFDFGETSPFHMEALNLEFPVHRFTCIKGRTGCGKSTVLNLLAGLYKPISGQILADDVPVNAYRSKWWQNRIGLVPPVVNVINASIYDNIALGVEPEAVDREWVHEICRIVELDELVAGLPGGYDSVYGEEGLSFSSGQIQKLGLARALYRRPLVLLLDESTDAFDLNTETRVLDRLKAMEGMTIIFVSHRPSVMEHADKLIDLEEEL
jgi:ABC-type bacteriocin/lantibiotic exporter with double-glycine peptidase domain